MIQITPISQDVIKMEIKLHIPQLDIINFLQKKGYSVAAYRQILPHKEEILLSEPRMEIYTFTATKPGEKQSEETEYLKVFEREIKELLKDLD